MRRQNDDIEKCDRQTDRQTDSLSKHGLLVLKLLSQLKNSDPICPSGEAGGECGVDMNEV